MSLFVFLFFYKNVDKHFKVFDLKRNPPGMAVRQYHFFLTFPILLFAHGKLKTGLFDFRQKFEFKNKGLNMINPVFVEVKGQK